MIRLRILISTALFSLLLTMMIPYALAQPTLILERTWGLGSTSAGLGVAIGASGEIVITGYTYSSASLEDVVILKYNSTGGLLWQRTWGGTNTDVGLGVTVDSNSSIYVTGYTKSFGSYLSTAANVFLLKFNSSGGLLWEKIWNDSGNDYGQSVAVDLQGEIYITGYTTSVGTGFRDVFLLKFDTSGNLLWEKTWGGNNSAVGNGVTVDASGNVYVTGYTNILGADVVLLKFNSTGGLLWQRTWGGSKPDAGNGVVVDSYGNIYVTGDTYSFGAGVLNVLLLKIDSMGGLIWQKTWGSGGNVDDGSAVAVDASGNVYVTGSTGSYSTGGGHTFILQLDSSGSLIWQKTLGGTENSGNGIAVDSGGNVAVVGTATDNLSMMGSPDNNTLGTASFALAHLTFTLGTPTLTLTTPTGKVGTPTGRQFSSRFNLFLLKYRLLSSPNGLAPFAFALPSVVIFVTAIWYWKRRATRFESSRNATSRIS